MAKVRKTESSGPGLLFILVTLVVVAVVGARFFGFYPGADETKPGVDTEDRGTQPPPAGEQAPPEGAPPTAEATRVLIYHSHATENYSPKESHQRGGSTGDIVAVGEVLARSLEHAGFEVIHNTAVHDKPRFSEAYANSAQMVEQTLQETPDIQFVFDVHRDGLQDRPAGFTVVDVDGIETAKVLFVVGDEENPRLEDNLAFARQLHESLERHHPDMSRGVRVFKSSYGGELHPNSVKLVIGDWQGNTLEQAQAAARLLASVIAEWAN